MDRISIFVLKLFRSPIRLFQWMLDRPIIQCEDDWQLYVERCRRSDRQPSLKDFESWRSDMRAW